MIAVIELANPYPDDDDALVCDVCERAKGSFKGRRTWFHAPLSWIAGAVVCDECAHGHPDVRLVPHPDALAALAEAGYRVERVADSDAYDFAREVRS